MVQAQLKLDINDVFPPESELGFPKRPPWSPKMSKVCDVLWQSRI